MSIWVVLKVALVVAASMRGRMLAAVFLATLPFVLRWLAIHLMAGAPDPAPFQDFYTALTGASAVSFMGLVLLAIYPSAE